MATATPTRPGTPRLSEIARRVHAPAGIVATGWPSVEAKSRDLGIKFRWWQCPIGQLILAKRADGTYASTIGGTGLSIPRQVGKTFLVAAVMFSLCMLRPGFTVLWTAHRLKTAEETFGKLQVFARRRRIAPHVRQVKTGAGEQQIIFRNGSRILFGARERGFGRGFDEVDALVFDEAQHMTDSALEDMVPATNQSRQPEGALMLFMGTPPRPQDPGEVFTRMRADAAAGDEDTGWVEFGADPDYIPTPLPQPLTDADWGQISAANPSFPEDTSRTAILRLRKKLGDDSFLREGCGIWLATVLGGVLDLGQWASLGVGNRAMVAPVLSVEVSLDRRSTIGAAWPVDDVPHLEVVEDAPGMDWVAERVHILAERYGGRLVVLDAGTEAAALAGPLEAAGLVVLMVKTADRVAACGGWHDAATNARLTHSGDPAIAAALANARWKDAGDGARVLARRKSAGDVAALYAVVLALHGLLNSPVVEADFQLL